MITAQEAKAKLKQIDASIKPDVEELAGRILDKQETLNVDNHDNTEQAKRLTLFIERRLAQPHLNYMPADQVNGVWGGSLTDALEAVGKRYNVAFDADHPAIGSDLLRAILDGSKAAEAPVTPVNTYAWLKSQVLAAGHKWDSDQMRFNVVGIRGYMVPGGRVPNDGNLWNDVIFLAWIDDKGAERIKAYPATVDPGRYYYSTRPINPKGCAHLMPGQYSYQKGSHNGHPAFVQAAAVTVARSNSANYTSASQTETGWFGINIHTGFGDRVVESTSAGCQCIKSNGWSDWRWVDFYSTLYSHAGKTFRYTLLESQKLKGL